MAIVVHGVAVGLKNFTKFHELLGEGVGRIFPMRDRMRNSENIEIGNPSAGPRHIQISTSSLRLIIHQGTTKPGVLPGNGFPRVKSSPADLARAECRGDAESTGPSHLVVKVGLGRVRSNPRYSAALRLIRGVPSVEFVPLVSKPGEACL